jgi:hypothetical protein
MTTPNPAAAVAQPTETMFLVCAGGDGYSSEIVPESKLDDAYLRTQWCTLDSRNAEEHRAALEHFHDPDEWTYSDPLHGGKDRIAVEFSISFEDGWVRVVRLPAVTAPAGRCNGCGGAVPVTGRNDCTGECSCPGAAAAVAQPTPPAAVPVDLPPLPKPLVRLRRFHLKDEHWSDWATYHDEYWGPDEAQFADVYTAEQCDARALAAIEQDRATRSAPPDEVQLDQWIAEAQSAFFGTVQQHRYVIDKVRAALTPAPVAQPSADERKAVHAIFERWQRDDEYTLNSAVADLRGALRADAGEQQSEAPALPPNLAWRDHQAAIDSKALATATEIALMWGQDRSQFVSRIQVAVIDAMLWLKGALPDVPPVPAPAVLEPSARALEFAEYMAKDANNLLDAINAEFLAKEAIEEFEEDETHDDHQNADRYRGLELDFDQKQQECAEQMRALRSGIYEFRKRAAKVGSVPAEEGREPGES